MSWSSVLTFFKEKTTLTGITTALGTAVGGPLGGIIGATVGNIVGTVASPTKVIEDKKIEIAEEVKSAIAEAITGDASSSAVEVDKVIKENKNSVDFVEKVNTTLAPLNDRVGVELRQLDYLIEQLKTEQVVSSNIVADNQNKLSFFQNLITKPWLFAGCLFIVLLITSPLLVALYDWRTINSKLVAVAIADKDMVRVDTLVAGLVNMMGGIKDTIMYLLSAVGLSTVVRKIGK